MTKTRITIADLEPLSPEGAVVTPNGYLSVPARVARTGTQEYYAFEFGEMFKDREWDSRVIAYRPEEEVFAPDSLASFSRLPVTDNHPWEDVSAANWKDHAVGMTEGEASRDGDFVSHRLLITDAGAVNDVQRGRRELSTGYTFLADLSPGITPQGQPYDLVQREIRANHIAIVDVARCGPECRAGDMAKSPAFAARLKDSAMCKCGKPEHQTKDSPMTTRTVAVDGLNVETTEAGAVALQKVIAERDEARAKIVAADAKVAESEAQRATDAANHAAALAAKDAQLAEAKQSIPDAARLEQMARDHAAFVLKAKAALPALDAAGKGAEAIRKEVVLAKLGDAAKDYTADQIAIAFDIVTKDAAPATGADPIVPGGAVQIQTGDNDGVQNTRIQKLQDAWKNRPAA